MGKAIQEHIGDVTYMGPDQSLISRLIEKGSGAANRCCYSTIGRRISPDHNRILSSRLAHVFEPQVKNSKCDIIFAPVASAEIAFLRTNIPIIYYSDLTWADIVDYYPGCASMFNFANRGAEKIEQSSLGRSAVTICPSEWVANTVINHYGIAQKRVYVIPDGANISDPPSKADALRHDIRGPLELLWMGVEWKRKGGAIAFECLKWLRASGVDAHLTVCGCTPPKEFKHENLRVIPFLNKAVEQDRKIFAKLFLESHFFLFPTLAEAFGIVLCESAAYGLPVLVRNTGGVGGAVVDGQSGFLMPPSATGADYAQRIQEILSNPALYRSLVVNSRDAYEQRLNWDSWGRSVKPIFEEVFARYAQPLEAR